MTKTIVGLYDSFAAAQQVAQELVEAGFSSQQISLVANDASGQYNSSIGGAEADMSGAGAGAGIGAVLGGMGGLLVGLGALAIPGIGPVIAAGPLATALLSTSIGAGVGAITGGLVDAGVPESEAEYYSEGVRRGGTLLTLQADNDASVERAMDIIERYDPVDIQERTSSWRAAGWIGFDPNAGPYTAADARSQPGNAGIGSWYSATSPTVPTGAQSMMYNEPAEGRANISTQDLTHNEPAEGQANPDQNMSNQGLIHDEPAEGRADINQEMNQPQTEIQDPTIRYAQQEAQETTGLSAAGDTYDTYYDTRFRQHYPNTGHDYSYYAPAYRYGYDLARDDDYDYHSWNEARADARYRWESTHQQGTWEQFKDARGDTYDTYDARFRQHYNTYYTHPGHDYSYYAPAYRYGYDLARSDNYDYNSWNEAEADACCRWESDHQGNWEQFKDAIRYAWEETKEAMSLCNENYQTQ